MPAVLLPAFLNVFTTLVISSATAGRPGVFSYRDDPGRSLEVLFDGRFVARSMDSGDVATPEKRVENYRPYLHVRDAEERESIAKGPGGDHPHQRGNFIGRSNPNISPFFGCAV